MLSGKPGLWRQQQRTTIYCPLIPHSLWRTLQAIFEVNITASWIQHAFLILSCMMTGVQSPIPQKKKKYYFVFPRLLYHRGYLEIQSSKVNISTRFKNGFPWGMSFWTLVEFLQLKQTPTPSATHVHITWLWFNTEDLILIWTRVYLDCFRNCNHIFSCLFLENVEVASLSSGSTLC